MSCVVVQETEGCKAPREPSFTKVRELTRVEKRHRARGPASVTGVWHVDGVVMQVLAEVSRLSVLSDIAQMIAVCSAIARLGGT